MKGAPNHMQASKTDRTSCSRRCEFGTSTGPVQTLNLFAQDELCTTSKQEAYFTSRTNQKLLTERFNQRLCLLVKIQIGSSHSVEMRRAIQQTASERDNHGPQCRRGLPDPLCLTIKVRSKHQEVDRAGGCHLMRTALTLALP